MIKGTTQSFKFKIPCDISDIYAAKVVFWQDDYNGSSADKPLPIVRTKESCYCAHCGHTIGSCTCDDSDSCEVYVKLTQSETLSFTESRKGKVQAIVSLISGESYATLPTIFTVYPIYGDDGAGGIDIPIPEPTDNGFIILDAKSVSE